MQHPEHIHTVTVQRGRTLVAARRVFRAKREANEVVTVPAGAKDFLVEIAADRDKIVALHVGAHGPDCPLDPPPVASWARGDDYPCPSGFLTSNPSDVDVDVHVSVLLD